MKEFLPLTIAVPTRHRTRELQTFFSSFYNNLPANRGRLDFLVIDDAPEIQPEETKTFLHGLIESYDDINIRYIHNKEKSSLAKMWNQSLVESKTYWTLICNDDAVFKPGWYEHLQSGMLDRQYLQINIMHYGAFCVSRQLVLKIGWFDERFRGGGYEDNDWQLRIYEAGLYDKIRSDKHTNIRNKEYQYATHKKVNGSRAWQTLNNGEHCKKKWGRSGAWHEPAYRRLNEVTTYDKIADAWSVAHSLEIEYRKYLYNSCLDGRPIWHSPDIAKRRK